VGEFFAIDAVIFVFAAMDGLEIEGMGEDELKSGFFTGVGKPRPGEEAFTADRQVVAPWSDLFEEEVKVVVLDIHVQELIALRVHDADVHLT